MVEVHQERVGGREALVVCCLPQLCASAHALHQAHMLINAVRRIRTRVIHPRNPTPNAHATLSPNLPPTPTCLLLHPRAYDLRGVPPSTISFVFSFSFSFSFVSFFLSSSILFGLLLRYVRVRSAKPAPPETL